MIGERLADLRKDMGITQDALAGELSISKFSISSYENDKTTPDDDMKIKIAQYFNVSIDYLLGVVNEPIAYKNDATVIRVTPKLPQKARTEIVEYVKFIKAKYKI